MPAIKLDESCEMEAARWLAEGASVVLQVPSAVIPQEANYLLNPLHPGISRVTVVSQGPFAYDPRLLG